MVKPELASGAEVKRLGKVIMGTVAGDIHDIGKNIVTFMLEVNGFEVYDLGVDVPAQRFVEKIEATEARILGLSGFLILTLNSLGEIGNSKVRFMHEWSSMAEADKVKV